MKIDYNNLKDTIHNVDMAMNDLTAGFDYFINMDSFQGQTADAAKSYSKEIHKSIIKTFQAVMTDLNLNLLNILEDFKEEVDDANSAVICTEHLEDILRQLEAKEEEYPSIANQFADILGGVSDIFSPETETRGVGNKIAEGYDETIRDVGKVRKSLIRFNEDHERDCDRINDTLDNLEKIISQISSISTKDGIEYSYGTISCKKELDKVNNYVDAVAVDLISKRLQPGSEVSITKEVELGKVSEGVGELINGVMLGVGGAIAIGTLLALTGGLGAIPLAILAVSGGLAVTMGGSDVYEGVQDIQNGLAGNSEEGFNPIRDTVFGGNQNLYNITEFAAGLGTTVGVEALTYKAAATSGTRVATNIAENASKGGSETVTYRRIQGGTGTKSSQPRISVDDTGKVSISNKNKNLNISIDEGEHAEHFLANRPGADIVEFDVPKWFDDFVKESAIPQVGYKSNPLNQAGTVPKITDTTTPGTSIEFPAPWVEWIEEYATNGRIIKGEN